MRLFIFLFVFWSGAALAQSYPDYQSTTVNDYANLLSDAEETGLSETLDQLRRETGVEMTVLTLATQAEYAPDKSLEQFATGLFNHWGVGDAQRNDGVLVMVVRNDRAMRIELGAAFARNWDGAATRVIEDHFLGPFAAGNYAQGILEGVEAIQLEIIAPFLAGSTPPSNTQRPKDSDNIGLLPFAGFFVVFLLFAGWQQIGDFSARFRSCPRCKERGLRQNRRETTAATRTATGSGMRRVSCTHCDYEEEFLYSIPRISSKSSGGFGGGSSGGGGGSGRW